MSAMGSMDCPPANVPKGYPARPMIDAAIELQPVLQALAGKYGQLPVTEAMVSLIVTEAKNHPRLALAAIALFRQGMVASAGLDRRRHLI